MSCAGLPSGRAAPAFDQQHAQDVGPAVELAAAGADPGTRRSRPAGSPPQRLTVAASSAAPVGVHSSYGSSPEYTGAPTSDSSSTTAGAGTGSTPCGGTHHPLAERDRRGRRVADAERVQRGGHARRRRRSRRARRPRGSAPRSGDVPCTAASARASRAKTSSARTRTGSGRSASSSRPRTFAQVRDDGRGLGARRARRSRPDPLVRPAPARAATGSVPTASTAACTTSSGTPASSSAPSSMSPLAPDSHWNHAVVTAGPLPGVAAPASLARWPGGRARRPAGHPRREHAGAEAVVDVDDDDAGRAGVEHREQGGEAAEGGAVADRRRDGDERHADQAADDRRQRALHPGDDDQAVGGVEVGRGRRAAGAARRRRRRRRARPRRRRPRR